MASQGADLWLTTTSSDKAVRLEQLGYQVQVVDFDRELVPWTWPTSFDYVLTSVPATSKFPQDVLEQRFMNVRKLLQRITYRKHIFLSSVGVYPDRDGVIDEHYAIDLNPRLLFAEELLKSLPHTLIFRLGGLFGKNRIFAKYFANRVCATGDQLANFVHLDDVVALLDLGFAHLEGGEVYNIVSPEYPTKEEVVRASTQKYGYDLPIAFEPKDNFQKKVLSTKIVAALNYSFIYSSPLDF